MPQGLDYIAELEMHTMTDISAPRTLCLCNTHATWGGGEKWHLETAKALVRRGWHIILLAHPACRLYDEALRFAESVEQQNQTIEHDVQSRGSLRVVPLKIKSLSFVNPCIMGRLVRFFRREKIHTVLVGLPAELKSVALAAKIAGVPSILYRRGSAFATRNTWSNRFLYGSVLTSLIVNSKQMQQHNAAIMPLERIHLLPNGIDQHIFDTQLQAASSYALGVPRRFVLGNAARLSPEKGQHYLIRLMADLKGMTCKNGAHQRNGAMSAVSHSGVSYDGVFYDDIQLLIAGDGELREQLESLAHELGVHDHITFLGFQDSLYAFWKSIDLFVFSSLREGLPNVLAESMMASVPVLAFNVSSIPELVNHGETGVLVAGPPEAMSTGRAHESAEQTHNTHDTESVSSSPSSRLATAVLELLENDASRQQLASGGRQHALATYSQEQCMDSLERILLS